MPLLTYPLALLALAAVPVFVAIYLFRNKFRQYPVSSLLLWQSMYRAREGGTRIKRLQLPWLFLLELLIIILLVLAATDPRIPIPLRRHTLIAVLDNSASMQAQYASGNARDRAFRFLVREIKRGKYHAVRLVLAGSRPQLLEPAVSSVSDLAGLLAQWNCNAPAAALEESTALALELSEPADRIMVLTDHAPDQLGEDGRIVWKAFGRPAPNVGFVNGIRTWGVNSERCFLEIAGFADVPVKTKVRIAYGPDKPFEEKNVTVNTGETIRLVFDLPPGIPCVHALLDRDGLPADNELNLFPESRKTVKALLAFQNEQLAEAVAMAVDATGLREPGSLVPGLVLTDSNAVGRVREKAWTVRFVRGEKNQSYIGPFVVNSSHPVTGGLQLQGVVWGASPDVTLPGTPVVMAGNIPLVTDEKYITGEHVIHIQYVPELSTLHATPNWPVLIWNIMNWRAGVSDGMRESNIRIGMPAVYNAAPGIQQVTVVEPGKRTARLPVFSGTALYEPEQCGVYHVNNGSGTNIFFAVNFLAPEESDTRNLSSGSWGDWMDTEVLQREYASLMWLFIAAALAALAAHMYVAARTGGRI
jgi:hypothetical protein